MALPVILPEIFVSIRLFLTEIHSSGRIGIVVIGARSVSIAREGRRAGLLETVSSGLLRQFVCAVVVLRR